MFQTIKDDFLSLARKKGFLILVVLPLILLLILRSLIFLFHDASGTARKLDPSDFYTLISLIIISVIPLVSAFASEKYLNEIKCGIKNELSEKNGFKHHLIIGLIEAVLISLIVTGIAGVISDPVPDQGWLRSLWILVIYGFHTSFYFLLFISLESIRLKLNVFLLLGLINSLLIPLGLLTDSYGKYLAFISPPYWLSWSWLTTSFTESVLSGLISVLMIFAGSIILYRRIMKSAVW